MLCFLYPLARANEVNSREFSGIDFLMVADCNNDLCAACHGSHVFYTERYQLTCRQSHMPSVLIQIAHHLIRNIFGSIIQHFITSHICLHKYSFLKKIEVIFARGFD